MSYYLVFLPIAISLVSAGAVFGALVVHDAITSAFSRNLKF